MLTLPTPAVFGLHVAFATALLCAASGTRASQPPVGEVTLTIGRAMMVSSTGESKAVQRGSKIQSGDRIETSDGGHVHIRFVDGALVSVRPTSRLVIEDYQYNPALPAQSTVRFRLDQGITRAISGEAAHAAKDRFRLNTPLVAIGVRGTDFVVRTQAGQTLAAVNQGSIVMAPFGDGCLPSTLGPCASAASRYLSADMGRVFAEFRSQFAQMDIKPLQQLQPGAAQVNVASNTRTDEPAATLPRESTRQESLAVAVTGNYVQDVLRKATSIEPAATAPPLSAVLPPVSVVPPVVAPPVVAPPVVTPPVVAPPVVAPPVVAPPVVVAPVVIPVVVAPPVVVTRPPVEVPAAPAQLAWGRWGPAGGSSSDFSVSLAAARTEGRQVTVGNDSYTLYRIEPTAGANIPNPVGPAFSFSLQQAYAQLATPTLVVPANVTGGMLTIDFAARQFVTSLNINSVPTGAIQLAGSGYIRGDGIFVGTNADQRIAGAMAVDTKSAGYFFEKFTNGALLSGITLWGR